MIDRARGPLEVTAIRVGTTELGAGTVSIDDDVVAITIPSSGDDVAMRMRLTNIDAAMIDDNALTIVLRDGRRVTLVLARAAELRDELLARCRALPELTRTLRALGSRRGRRGLRDSASNDQQRFFAPLIQARRMAGGAREPDSTIAAFDAMALIEALETTLSRFATERHGADAPARRALEAELVDLSEPLRAALDELAGVATQASAACDDLRLWRAWALQLRYTFEAADRVWISLDVALDATSWRP